MKRSFFLTNFFRECYAVFVLAHSLTLFGANGGFSSFLIPRLKQESIIVSVIEESCLGALSDLITTICIPPTIFLVIKFGRKKNLHLIFAIYAIGWLLLAVSPNIVFIYISIVVISIGSAPVMPIVATYIVETCRVKRRGVYLSLEFIFLPIGGSLDLILNYFLPWRTVAVVMATISVSGLIQSFVIPETKYWYILKNQPHLAKSSLLWFEPNLSAETIRRQIENMRHSAADAASDTMNNRRTFFDFFKSFARMDYVKPMLSGLILSVLRGFSGRTLAVGYTVDVFARLNTPYDSEKLSFWFGWLQNVGNLYFLFLTHRYKRKTTFYNIACVMIVCLISIICINLYRGDDEKSIPLVIVALTFLYFSTACTGYISSIGVIVAEIQSARFRAEVMNLCSFIFMLTTFVLDFTYPSLITTIDLYLYFVSFLVGVVIASLIVYFLIPETSEKEFCENQVFDTRL